MGRAATSLRETQTTGRDSVTPVAPREPPTQFATASHEALFEAPDESRCDVCGAVLGPDAEEGCAVGGAGMLLWVRGDEVRREIAPLCADCGTAVFASALIQFDLDDEE